ncbi:MAG: hypothetical protein ACI4EA_02350 [Candidatus Ornithomonoglobus sp.]
MHTTERPTEREKRFDAFIRQIIDNGLNYFERPTIYLESNREGMKELYDLLDIKLPKGKTDGSNVWNIYANGHNYAVTDKRLYDALQQLSKDSRNMILLCYWDGVKDYWLVRKHKISIRALKRIKSNAINNMRDFLSERKA